MDWQLSSIGPPMGTLLFGLIRTRPEERDHAVIEAARRKALAAWTIVDEALEDRPYLAGGGLTLAEITLGTLVYRWHAFSIERPLLKNLRAWYERMREHPPFQRHIEIPIT
jgi:glutathione S-transferase